MPSPAEFHVRFLALVCLLTLVACVYQETVTKTSSDLVFPPRSGESLLKKGRYFIVYPNDTTLLAGKSLCTTAVNGNVMSVTVDSVYCQTITGEPAPLTIGKNSFFVYPQVQSQGKNLAQLNTVATRFFELTETEILLRGFSTGNSFISVKDSVAMPHVLSANLTWPVPLLVSLPAQYLQPGITILGTGLIVEFDHEVMIDTNIFRDGLLVKLYYELSGTLVQKKVIKRVLGTLVVNRYFVKDIGLLEQEQLLHIQTVTETGHTEIKKERLNMKRNAVKLQPVPEQLIKIE